MIFGLTESTKILLISFLKDYNKAFQNSLLTNDELWNQTNKSIGIELVMEDEFDNQIIIKSISENDIWKYNSILEIENTNNKIVCIISNIVS